MKAKNERLNLQIDSPNVQKVHKLKIGVRVKCPKNKHEGHEGHEDLFGISLSKIPKKLRALRVLRVLRCR